MKPEYVIRISIWNAVTAAYISEGFGRKTKCAAAEAVSQVLGTSGAGEMGG